MLKLSKLQREIIQRVQLDADFPPAVLAKQLGARERAVRYQLAAMVEKGIMHKAPFINIYPLGLRYVNIYFSAGSAEAKTAAAFAEHVMRTPEVSWLAELGGDFHYGMSIAADQIDRTKAVLDPIARRFPSLFFEKSYAFHLGLTVFPYKYLAPGKFSFPSLGYSAGPVRTAIDELDARILEVMSEEHLTSGRAVARRLGKPHATIELRLRRLEKERIIAGYWYLVNPQLFGYQTLKLLVYAKGLSGALAAQLFEFAKDHPNIVYYIECIGSWDFELGLDVAQPQDAVAVTRRIFDRFGGMINTVKAVPLFRVLKWRQYPADRSKNQA